MPEIRPNQLTLADRRRVAALLEAKLVQPIDSVDDLIDRLQLALAADLDPQLGRRAGEQIWRAFQTMTSNTLLVELGGDQGHDPLDFFAPTEHEAARRGFYAVEQALLPLRGTGLLSRGPACDRIFEQAIAALREHGESLRRIVVGMLETHRRRVLLRDYVRAGMMNMNRGQILVNCTARAAQLVRGKHAPARQMLADLFAVIIGNNMTDGRLSGPYFAGNLPKSGGFLPQYQDPYNQVQHAIAGVIIGNRTGPFGSGTMILVEALRWQPQDLRLYLATCWIGAWLGDGNYYQLSEKLRLAVCDATVVPA